LEIHVVRLTLNKFCNAVIISRLKRVLTFEDGKYCISV
jgi:hypothetical protein